MTDGIIDTDHLPWAQRQRLAFIDFRLIWDGRINRGDLKETFDLSEQQASADLSRYMACAPLNIRYDASLKTYVRGANFIPLFQDALPDGQLLHLLAVNTGRDNKEGSWFGNLPPIAVTVTPRRAIAWHILARVVDAIRGRRLIDIDYRFTCGKFLQFLQVAPHALCYGAGRWHMRAWTRDHNSYRDFALDQILAIIGGGQICDIDPRCDRAWLKTFRLSIVPNPHLDRDTKRAVELAHDMTSGRLSIALPVSQCRYLIEDLQLDLAEKVRWGKGGGKTVSPARLPLVLENHDAFQLIEAETHEATTLALIRSRDEQLVRRRKTSKARKF